MIQDHKRILGSIFISLCCLSGHGIAHDIIEIQGCNPPLDKRPVYRLLDQSVNILDGWNHIDTKTAEFSSLAQQNSAYKISQEQYSANDPDCDGVATQKAVLVAKLSDWTHQHANGLEAKITGQELSYADIANLVLDLKLSTANTKIMGPKGLQQRYQTWLQPAQLDKLDNGKATLLVTLFAKGALDQHSRSLSAEYFIELDPLRMADRWLRLIIPISDFEFYYEQEYARETVAAGAEITELIEGFRLTAESHQGVQIRNLMKDGWNSQIPETFKEIGLEIRRIALTE